MYILYVLRKTDPQYCIISNELVTKNDPVKNTTREIKNKKTVSIILCFKEEFHLLHGQVLVLKNRTFHQKVLSKLYRNYKFNFLVNFNFVLSTS